MEGREGGTRRSYGSPPGFAILSWRPMTAVTTDRAAGLTPPSGHGAPYRWAAAGDVNAFFGLMLDNVVSLAVLAGILVGAFGFPAALVSRRMFPGTALGVLFGDVVYTIMAIRLARRTGRSDV